MTGREPLPPVPSGRMPAAQTARLLDHEGNWTQVFPLADVITCRGADGIWDHKLFGSSQVHPGDNVFQAMTFCGKRALEVPGKTGIVGCPACLEYMAGDEAQ